MTEQKLSGVAVIFIPAFCVAEVLNTFARWWYRERSVFATADEYNFVRQTFIKHVHDRKFFYSYDLTRYHNLNCGKVFHKEHKTKLTRGTYLSAFDILVIAMGMELKRICGDEIHLLTKDYRQYEIAGKAMDFPKAYFWPETPVKDLPTA